MEPLHIFLERNTEDEPGWQVRKINHREQDEWRKGRRYLTVEAFLQEEVKRGQWGKAGVDHGESDASITFWR